MRHAIEQLLKSKSLTNRKAFLQALAGHDIYLTAIDKYDNPQFLNIFATSLFAQHKRSEDQCDLLIQKNDNGDSFFLGFTDPISFKNWQFKQGSIGQNMTTLPIGFSNLCLLMKEVERQETGLILNPDRDNLIIDNSVFDDLQNISTAELADVAHKNYIAMTPLEEGDFSFDLLHLLHKEFNAQDWIRKAWAASAEIEGAESFLLIIASENLNNQSDQSEKHQLLHQKLLETCGAFLVGASLNIQSSTTQPFDAAILNYHPIFARKQG